MRITQVTPLHEAVRPYLYGGTPVAAFEARSTAGRMAEDCLAIYGRLDTRQAVPRAMIAGAAE